MTCVMNHNVKPTMLSDNPVDCCFAGLFRRNVELDRPQIDSVVSSILLYWLDLWFVTPIRFSHAGVHCVTCSSQRTSGECAKSTRSPGNDDDVIHISNSDVLTWFHQLFRQHSFSHFTQSHRLPGRLVRSSNHHPGP